MRSFDLQNSPEDWHAWRQQGIGGSDAAAACGASRYKTPYQLWLEKTGQGESRLPSEPMQWGLQIEPMITSAYEDRTGRTVHDVQSCVEHLSIPWLRATLDGIAGDRVVECKTVGFGVGRSLGENGDSDSLPNEWILQVQHQLAVTGMDVCDVAVFLGHLLELRIYTVERRNDLIQNLLTVEDQFWGLVQDRRPPSPDTLDDVVDFSRRFRASQDRITIDDPQVGRAVACYQELGKSIKESERLRNIYKTEIMRSLDGHEYGDLADGRIIRAQTIEIEERQQTVKAHTQLRLTIREP